MNRPSESAERSNETQPKLKFSIDSPIRLSILLVNYNGLEHLAGCLESIQRFMDSQTEVILEDNASTDGSPDRAEQDFPWLQVVRSEQNLGFAGGNNLAARRATGEFILLLNTDTLLLESITPVLNWLDAHPTHGALTVNMIDGNQRGSACTGRFPTPSRLTLLRSMLTSPSRYGDDEAYDVDWVQGSFLMIRAKLWRELNGLDERYFMYGEDVDLCKRISDSGLRCAYLPHFRYLHWGGFNVSRFPDQVRGLATYIDLHMTGVQRLLCRAVLLCGCLLRAVSFRISGTVRKSEVDRTKATASWRAFSGLLDPSAKGPLF